MKHLNNAIAIVALVATPISAFSQSNQPLSRAQVRDELVQLHNAGYNPLDDRNSWPTHIQAAEARIAAQKEAASAANSSYGAVTTGSSEAGH